MNAEPPITPACSQCRVRKVRCRREQPVCSNCVKSGLSCDYSNQTKRINHTKQLAEDFSHVSNRLERIETTLERINLQLGHSYIQPREVSDPTGNQASASTTTVNTQGLHRVACRNTSQHYLGHGPTSDEALFQGAIDTASRALTAHSSNRMQSLSSQTSVTSGPLPYQVPLTFHGSTTDKIESTTTQSKQVMSLIKESLPLPLCCDKSSVTSDGRPVSAPPQSFVLIAVRHYLAESEHLLPIFDAEKLKQVAETHYTNPPSNAHSAWSLCLNNIVVLAMRSRLSNAPDPEQSGQGTMEPGLYARFLANSARAFSNLDVYTGPDVVNVQALLTLALVALEHFSSADFNRIVRRACLVGQDMQLQYAQPDPAHNRTDARERQKVFWALYTADKERCFLSGESCDIYQFDSQVALPASTDLGEMTEIAIQVARIQMMSLWEKVWTALYSAQAQQCASVERASRITRIDQHFLKWANQYYPKSQHGSITKTLDGLSSSRLQLCYCYHIGRLYLDVFRTDDSSKQDDMHDARMALHILTSIFEAEESTMKLILLARLCLGHSIIPFFQLHKHLLVTWTASSEEDLSLLRRTTNILNFMASNSRTGQSSFSILLGKMNWCLTMNKLVNSLNDRPFDQELFQELPNVSDHVWNTLRQRQRQQAASGAYDASYIHVNQQYDLPTALSSESSSMVLSPTSQPLMPDFASDFAFANQYDAGYADDANDTLQGLTQFDAVNTMVDLTQYPVATQQYYINAGHRDESHTTGQAFEDPDMTALSAGITTTMALPQPDDLTSTASIDISADPVAESSQSARNRASSRRKYSKSARLM